VATTKTTKRKPAAAAAAGPSLADMHGAATRAGEAFRSLVASKYPGANDVDWEKAKDAATAGRATDLQKRLAADVELDAAFKAHIDLLQDFYAARFGPKGVLGGL